VTNVKNQTDDGKVVEARPWRNWLAVLGAYVVLPNLPFLIAGRFIYTERAAINLDYVVLGLLSPLFSKGLNLTLFSVVLLLDILFSTSGVYHFPVADEVRALRSVGHVSLAITIPILLLTILGAWVVVRLATRWRRISANRGWRELTAVLLILVALDLANGLSLGERHRLVPFRIARSSVGTTAIAVARDFRPLNLRRENFWMIESATRNLDGDATGGKLAGENVVLVVVESMGAARDAALAAWIEAPVLNEEIRRRYQVKQGTAEFDGSTTFGELRELCGIRGIGMRMAELQPSQTGECLPAKLRAMGYETVAVHGVTSAMFNRNRWYPTLGFDRLVFPENWPRGNPQLCSAQFHAICDADTAQVVHDELIAATLPKFVYWLTVESHLQLDDAAMTTLSGECRGLVPDVCWMVTTQRNALAQIARIALDPALKPTRFVIVGDHSPPFMLRSKRNLFADRRVPWVELRPLK
jgi:hypothetical protein